MSLGVAELHLVMASLEQIVLSLVSRSTLAAGKRKLYGGWERKNTNKESQKDTWTHADIKIGHIQCIGVLWIEFVVMQDFKGIV